MISNIEPFKNLSHYVIEDTNSSITGYYTSFNAHFCIWSYFPDDKTLTVHYQTKQMKDGYYYGWNFKNYSSQKLALNKLKQTIKQLESNTLLIKQHKLNMKLKEIENDFR